MLNFCTLFNRDYYAKGMALISSIHKWMPEAQIYVLFVGEIPYIRDTHVTLLREVMNEELVLAKSNRTSVEFLWSLASWWSWRLLQELDSVIYVDADTFFFKPLPKLKANIAICPHRWSPQHKKNLIANGIYNVGLVQFKKAAMQCATDWKDNVLEWCYYKNDGEKFGDQGYLNNWVKKYGAQAIRHRGVNLGPWAQEQYDYCLGDDGALFIEHGKRCDPLVLYHFHGYGSANKHDKGWSNYELHPMIEQHVYAPYETEVAKWTFGSDPK